MSVYFMTKSWWVIENWRESAHIWEEGVLQSSKTPDKAAENIISGRPAV